MLGLRQHAHRIVPRLSRTRALRPPRARPGMHVVSVRAYAPWRVRAGRPRATSLAMTASTTFRTGTHVFTTHDGEQMIYYTLGDRSSPPVLLLHGCEHACSPSVCQRLVWRVLQGDSR